MGIYFATQSYLALSSRARWRSHSVIHTQWSADGTRIDTICHQRHLESNAKRHVFRCSPQPEQFERSYLRVSTIRSSFDNREKRERDRKYHKNLSLYWKHKRIAPLWSFNSFRFIIYVIEIIKLLCIYFILFILCTLICSIPTHIIDDIKIRGVLTENFLLCYKLLR